VIAEVSADEGMDLRLKTPLESVRRSDGRMQLVAGGEKLEVDALLMAVGRQPVLDELGLESAGVAYDANGIEVNRNLRTSRRHIYAAGDCTGGPQFTHYAGWQAAVAVRNALIAGTARGTTEVVPWTTFADPEVAHVGMSEEEARRRYGDTAMICDWPMADVDRARAEGETTAFLRLVHLKNGKLLGAAIVAARASETGWSCLPAD
jgi:pyruvate/2-oxoglutarate dehydrogenase complex dihydrolipoamide dehydrogenase (E3) component